MNIDDPKLTAFALGELEEPERSAIEREVSASPEAQRVVDETRQVSRLLRNEFSAEVEQRSNSTANLVDIHDDPWFWSVARPLAIAAAITIFAIIGAIAFSNYSTRHNSIAGTAISRDTELEGEEKPQAEASPEFVGPNSVPNPLLTDTIQRVERIVIGEIDADPHLETGEIRVIEIINDAYRLKRLRERLTTPVLSKKSHRGLVGGRYELMFLDRTGHVVASAAFSRQSSDGFVLQPLRNGYERDGRYFTGEGSAPLPGDWISGVDYDGYVIPFPDWAEALGYSPS